MDRGDLDHDAWLTAREAANIIGCGNRKLLRLIESGKIEAHKDGRSYLVSLTSARAYRQSEMNSKGKQHANGEGSGYESPKGSGRWYAVVTIKVGTKSKRIKRKANSQKEALERRDELRKISSKPQEELQKEQKPLLVDELMVEWLEVDVRGSVREYLP